MDRQIDNTKVRAETKNGAKQPSSYRTGHLMCRTPLWGVAGFLGCAYFAWISFSRAALHIVAIRLLAVLARETPCRRERVFFGLLVIIFGVGCGLPLWSTVPSADVRSARIGTGAHRRMERYSTASTRSRRQN